MESLHYDWRIIPSGCSDVWIVVLPSPHLPSLSALFPHVLMFLYKTEKLGTLMEVIEVLYFMMELFSFCELGHTRTWLMTIWMF